MTAIKPIENRRVRGVASERYPLNETSSHPTSSEPTVDPHHCWPRSAIGNDSWFVEITEDDGSTIVIPHVTGLTRAEHELAESGQAWIKYEDGVFVWYDRRPDDEREEDYPEWLTLGPLNPQPGSREGKPKRKKRASTPEERKARVNFAIRTPVGEENVLPELMEFAQEAFQKELGADELPMPYVTAAAALKEFIEAHG